MYGIPNNGTYFETQQICVSRHVHTEFHGENEMYSVHKVNRIYGRNSNYNQHAKLLMHEIVNNEVNEM